MTTKTKKIKVLNRALSIFLVIVLLLSVFPISGVMAIDGGDISSTGIHFTSEGNIPTTTTVYTAGSGTVTWEPYNSSGVATLTFNNATIDTSADTLINYAVEITVGDTTKTIEIVMTGSSKIKSKSTAIFFEGFVGRIEISGNGSLSAQGTYAGLRFSGDLNMTSGNLELESTYNGSSSGYVSFGFYASGTNRSVNISGGNLVLRNYCYSTNAPILANSNMNISGSANVSSIAVNGSYGLSLASGYTLTVNTTGTVQVSGSDTGIIADYINIEKGTAYADGARRSLVQKSGDGIANITGGSVCIQGGQPDGTIKYSGSSVVTNLDTQTKSLIDGSGNAISLLAGQSTDSSVSVAPVTVSGKLYYTDGATEASGTLASTHSSAPTLKLYSTLNSDSALSSPTVSMQDGKLVMNLNGQI